MISTDTKSLIKSIEESRYPLTIPFGWFVVSYSDQLRKNTAKPLHYFGKDLVLFRNGKGAVGLLNAYCPHMGAHLGHDSQVDDDGVICPFHAWKWSPRGKCLEIPYSDRIPAGVARDQGMHAYETVERNGAIYAWHHPLNKAPLWDIVERPEIHDPSWTKEQYRQDWVIASHLQEQAENSVDGAHFKYVHGTMDIPDASFQVDGIIRRSKVISRMKTSKGIVMGSITVEAKGPGYSVTRFSGICETLLFVHGTPIDDAKTHLRFAFIQEGEQKKGMQGGVHKAMVKEICKQVEEDIPIWESKRFYYKPILCDGDGEFHGFRNYYRQFYALPEKGETFEKRCEQWYEFWEKGQGHFKKIAPARHYDDGLVSKDHTSQEPLKNLPEVGREEETFPPGWYAVAREIAFQEGDVVASCAFGRDLVLFKTTQGYAATDAYCPHMGAHLGKKPHGERSRNVRLRVEDDAIVCPFHAWRWDKKGRCVGIPYAKKIPVGLKREGTLPTYPLKTLDGIVYVLHHPEIHALKRPTLPPFEGKSLRSSSQTLLKWDISLDVSYETWVERFFDRIHYHHLADVKAIDLTSQDRNTQMPVPFKMKEEVVILAHVCTKNSLFETTFHDLPFKGEPFKGEQRGIMATLRQSVTPVNGKQITIRGMLSYEQGEKALCSSIEMYLKEEYTLLMCQDREDDLNLVPA